MHSSSCPMGSMKVSRGFITWEHDLDPPSLSLSCKRFRPLAPKLPASPTHSSTSDVHKASPTHSKRQVESHPGGTRWNPTQEQIGILEMLYRGGMRTPNAQQIEQITLQLSKYGKIEGKNVFYWFQNHKARERQKQKRNSLGLAHSPRTSTSSLTTITLETRADQEESPRKRKSRSWAFECLEEEKWRSWSSCKDREGDRTLELFPLHPESR